jgi:hypothetical protein
VPRLLWWSSLGLLLALLGCTADEATSSDVASDEPAATEDAGTEDAASDDATDGTGSGTDDPEPARECRHDGLEEESTVELVGHDPVTTSHELVRRSHSCAETVLLVSDDAWAAAIGVAVAVDADAPLLLVDADAPATSTEMAADLEPTTVITLGVSDGELPLGADVGEERIELTADDAEADPVGRDAALALAAIEHLDADRAYAVADDDDEARAAAVTRNGGGTPLLPVPSGDDELAALAAELSAEMRLEVVATDEDRADTLADRLVDVGLDAVPAEGPAWDPGTSDTVWLVDPSQGTTTAAVVATAIGRGEAVHAIDADDLRAGRSGADPLVDLAPERAVLVGEVTEDASWQLPALLEGPRLPGGRLLLFEDTRMVALYGTPSSNVLGALGEQGLDETVARAREVAEPYGADGMEVLPAFEMIVTIASAQAGTRGDYSNRLDPDSFRPWVERAAEEGFYVILDLQPGRTDFLEQAQEYESLLLEPHVGLALDPEWRLEDDQVHLRQIGSVDAEEVQRVADWLAELTREHHLPQKLLILHQFRHTMLPDRDTIEAPRELAVVVHMDGQGPIGTKYETYASLTAGAEDRWLWGWKNFYDEDHPTPTPEQVLDLDPLPVFVSYQ